MRKIVLLMKTILIEAVRRLRETAGSEGVKAFVLPIEEMT